MLFRSQLEVRIEDFKMSSFLPATEKDDRLLYLKTVWQQDILSGAEFEAEPQSSADDLNAIDACEKVIDYYLSQLGANGSLASKVPGLAGLVEKAATGPETDEFELMSIMAEFGEQVDMQLVRTIGDKLLDMAQGILPADSQGPESLHELVTRWHNEGDRKSTRLNSSHWE